MPCWLAVDASRRCGWCENRRVLEALDFLHVTQEDGSHARFGRRDPVGSAVLTATARETRKLLSGGVVLLRPEEAVLETALGCWVMQMESRNLTARYIEDSYRAVLRFRDHTYDYPWNWSAGDLEAWSSELLAGRQARTVRTLQNHIGRFLGYLLDPA